MTMKSMNSTDATKWLTTPPPAPVPAEHKQPCDCHVCKHPPAPSSNPKTEDVASKPEGTPVGRWLTEIEQGWFGRTPDPRAADSVIERLCRELDARDKMPSGQLLDVHAICDQRDAAVQDAQEQRRRADRIDRNATAVVNQLKYDLAAAQLREKGLREALGHYTAQGTIGPDEEGRTLTVKCDPSIARAALAKEDK